eukprot:6533860-Pyramimonas_sp.AAC.1
MQGFLRTFNGVCPSGGLLGISWGVWGAITADWRPSWASRTDRPAILSPFGPFWGFLSWGALG